MTVYQKASDAPTTTTTPITEISYKMKQPWSSALWSGGDSSFSTMDSE